LYVQNSIIIGESFQFELLNFRKSAQKTFEDYFGPKLGGICKGLALEGKSVANSVFKDNLVGSAMLLIEF
jgi:hypothetical protein